MRGYSTGGPYPVSDTYRIRIRLGYAMDTYPGRTKNIGYVFTQIRVSDTYGPYQILPAKQKCPASMPPQWTVLAVARTPCPRDRISAQSTRRPSSPMLQRHSALRWALTIADHRIFVSMQPSSSTHSKQYSIFFFHYVLRSEILFFSHLCYLLLVSTSRWPQVMNVLQLKLTSSRRRTIHYGIANAKG